MGPAIAFSDLLVINKAELAVYVDADTETMRQDAAKVRGERPFVFADLKSGLGVDLIVDWFEREVLFLDLVEG